MVTVSVSLMGKRRHREVKELPQVTYSTAGDEQRQDLNLQSLILELKLFAMTSGCAVSSCFLGVGATWRESYTLAVDMGRAEGRAGSSGDCVSAWSGYFSGQRGYACAG